MKKYTLTTTVLCVLIGLCVPAFAASKNPAEDLFYSKCSRCHGSELALKKKKSHDQWIDTIKRMETFGLDISRGERKDIADYLAKRK
ncbi:c-type cytochrome [Seleniivibrio woodruffii]|uniref:c-type cytochrome n=1 Tax=Seleniivibrio woodruffii TaxID=1078050 RepID=UPI00240A44CA|nr:cytochrome c [Seleniivibrio woodruffii]